MLPFFGGAKSGENFIAMEIFYELTFTHECVGETSGAAAGTRKFPVKAYEKYPGMSRKTSNSCLPAGFSFFSSAFIARANNHRS
jgi:hypothetical protein